MDLEISTGFSSEYSWYDAQQIRIGQVLSIGSETKSLKPV